MKKIIFCLLVLSTSTSFAQDMSRTESGAYKNMPDGSSVYIGKCKTHEAYQGKTYQVTRVIQEYVEPMDLSLTQVKKIVEKIGMVQLKIVMKNFFDFADMGTDQKTIKSFIEYADDITVEAIQLKDSPNMDLIRFNIGYGGGNGGYLVLLKTSTGYEKMSLTGDGDLNYCDLKVWKKKK